MKKQIIQLGLILFVSAILFSSCLNSNNDLSTEGTITYLDLPNQNGYLEFYTREFTISEVPDAEGYYIITNEEPLPFGALDDSLYTRFYTSNSNIVSHTFQYVDTNNVTQDSTFVITSNSATYKLDYSKDIVYDVYAEDINYVKHYKVQLVVSDENPDELVWSKTEGTLPFDQDGHFTAYSLNGTTYVLWGKADETNGIIENALYSTTDGTTWTTETLTEGSYPKGIYQAIGKYNSEIICFSTLDLNANKVYEVNNTVYWKTTDGVNWTSDTIEVNTPEFAFQHMAYLNGTLFAFGGTKITANQSNLNSALYNNGTVPEGSTDIYLYNGSAWTKSSATLPTTMASRFGGVTTGKGRIYLTNGETAGETADQDYDMWATESGEYWLRTGRGTTPPLYGTQLTYFNSHLWRVGGYEVQSDTILNKILTESVDDGNSWFDIDAESSPYLAPPTDFISRYDHAVVIDNQKRLWVIGGKDSNTDTSLNEVWMTNSPAE